MSGEKEQDADEAASLMLKEIDAKSFHNGHRLSAVIISSSSLPSSLRPDFV